MSGFLGLVGGTFGVFALFGSVGALWLLRKPIYRLSLPVEGCLFLAPWLGWWLLIAANQSGKSLSNLVVEPALAGIAVSAGAVLRSSLISRFTLRPAVLISLVTVLAATAAIWACVPILRE